MKAKDLMSPRIEWVHPALPIREAARRMRTANVGCVPVGEDGQLLGMLTDRDIVCRLVANGSDADRTHVYDVMTPDVATCRDDQDAQAAAAIMRARRVRRLPVIDRRNNVVGLLALDDLCGQIPDEVFAATLQTIAHARDDRKPAPAAAPTA